MIKIKRKKKIGRNDPCPCGSGVKYKKCHGRFPAKTFVSAPKQFPEILKTLEATESRRQSQQGKGRPIISTEFQGYRFTAIGNKLLYSKNHKTFIDFLGDYIRSVLDPQWGNDEIAKPLQDRHQILQWYNEICAYQKANIKKPKGEIQSTPIIGLLAAYYGLAYNLYLLKHNAELQRYLIQRLKQHESFYAAYYETYVAAWFILAGFVLRLEDERDSTRTHPEFVAMRDGKSYSVEAKTRQPGKNHFDIGNQLYTGLCIETRYPRVVFIDMNVGTDIDIGAFRNGALAAIKGREPKLTIQGEPAPSAFIYVTNQPYHLALNETRLPRLCLTTGFKIPDFGYGAFFTSYTEAFKAHKKYEALYDVQKVSVSYEIPATFDGEIPEFAFGEAERRLNIGERLEVADGVFVTVQSGIVVEQEKKAYLGVSYDNGEKHIMTTELSDTEISAYRAHPETFFGRVVKVSKHTKDPLELYTFFIENYKETSRDKLLNLMSGSPDIEELKNLSEDELRYTFAERLTHSAIRDKNK